MTLRCIVMGAAGRDFHDFRTFFRGRPELRVVAFTAAQIPFIERRVFPHELAGPDYPDDIPIFPEEELPALIERLRVDFVFLAYSDLAHVEVMHKASLVQSKGAAFALLGPRHTMLTAKVPVIAVTASRTGAGKSPLTQWLARALRERGERVAVLRHPMPYGDLRKQAVERFDRAEDLDRHECTIEEREEYEPYLEAGITIWAGVDYATILAAAERDADVVLWDGGNNDYPFVAPNVWITVLDPLRAGDEVAYYPGETNLRSADILVIGKVSSATAEQLATVRANAARWNPRAACIEADLAISIDREVVGRRAIVVEDGPTVTHGGMPSGAGLRAALEHGAVPVDPRPFAVGTIAEAYARNPHLGPVLPALGYSPEQRRELAETIARAFGEGSAEIVIDGSPARLEKEIPQPIARVSYRFVQRTGEDLAALVDTAIRSRRRP